MIGDRPAIGLARLAQRVTSGPSMFFGTVTATTPTSVTIRPDAQDEDDGVTIGPVPLVGTSAPVIGDRVCCIRSVWNGAVACIGKVGT